MANDQRQFFQAPQQGGGRSRDSNNQGFQAPRQPNMQLPEFNLPGFSGQSGGSTSLDGVGTATAGNEMPGYVAQVGALGNAFGDQLGLIGNLANTQGGVDQARIGASSNDYGNELNAGTQRYQSDSQLRQAELVAKIQQELGMYQSDQGLAGELGVAELGLEGTQAQADASRYGADQNLAGVTTQAQFGALPAYYQQQRFNTAYPDFMKLAQGLLGGGGGGGLGAVNVPALNAEPALNQQLAANAQQEAMAGGSQGYGGGSPQAGGYSRNNEFDRMQADTMARQEIPLAYARENREGTLAGIAAENDRMRAQASQLSPLMSLIGQFA